jgi:RNA polymerase sigma-70 factor (ECF subfamily)
MSNPPNVPPPDDRDEVEEWLKAARAGSGEALGRLLDAFRRYLLLVAHRELDSELQAKQGPSDLVQDTFLNAQKNFAQFRGATESEFLAWLHGILKNSASDFQRRYLQTGKRQVGREVGGGGEDSSGGLAASLPDSGETPSRQVSAREEAELLERALLRLPEDYQQVIRLRSAEGRPFAEIGKQLNRSEDAARMLWLRAFKQLQKEMNPAHDAP